MSALVWFMAGLKTGLTAGVATLFAGGLLADFMRTMGLNVLERRVSRLVGDVGSAVWPGAAARVLP